jgi:hypothetical protein
MSLANEQNTAKEKSVSSAAQKTASAEAGKTASNSDKSGSGSAANAIIIPDMNNSPAIGISIWKKGIGLGVGLMELVVLGIISSLVVSDMRVIIWFEKKKKSRF